MVLPITIGDSDTDLPDQNYYCGPEKSSGDNFYLLTSQRIFDGFTLTAFSRIFKATDPRDSWTAQDTANEPSTNITDPTETAWLFRVSDVLHMSYFDTIGYRYITFNMANDTWGSELTIENPSNIPNSTSCSLAVRDDGDVIVEYNGDTDKFMGQDRDRVDHARKENGTFATVGIEISDSASNQAHDWYGSVIVKGESDRMHFFFSNRTLLDAFQRTLLSDNSLEAFPSAGDSNTGAINLLFGPGFNAAGEIRVPYYDSNAAITYAEFTSADAPGAFTQNPVGEITVEVNDGTNGSPVACLAFIEADEHLLYSDVSLNDLTHDVNESDTDDTEFVGVITGLSCNIYDREGSKLAYLIDDGGTIKYNERIISPGARTTGLRGIMQGA